MLSKSLGGRRLAGVVEKSPPAWSSALMWAGWSTTELSWRYRGSSWGVRGRACNSFWRMILGFKNCCCSSTEVQVFGEKTSGSCWKEVGEQVAGEKESCSIDGLQESKGAGSPPGSGGDYKSEQ